MCNHQPSITQVLRAVKRQEHSIFNCIASIVHDSEFVRDICESREYSDFPVLGNLRCGAWYVPATGDTCYFKSTDGHNGHWSFSLTRLNFHVVELALSRGGVCIVDATRRGKCFPVRLLASIGMESSCFGYSYINMHRFSLMFHMQSKVSIHSIVGCVEQDDTYMGCCCEYRSVPVSRRAWSFAASWRILALAQVDS